MSCERLSVADLPDHRKVIEEIVHAAPDGILISELPQLFEVSSCWSWPPTQKCTCTFTVLLLYLQFSCLIFHLLQCHSYLLAMA